MRLSVELIPDPLALRQTEAAAMKRAVLWIVLACCAGLACNVILHRWRSKANNDLAPAPSEPLLAIAQSDLHLGRVYENEAYPHPFRVTNQTNDTVTISRFLTSCDCAGIAPAVAVTLQPHESRPFTITLSLHAKGNEQRKMEPELFHVNFAALCYLDKDALPPLAASSLGLLASPMTQAALLGTSVAFPARFARRNAQRTNWRLIGEVLPTLRPREPTIDLGMASDHQGVIEVAT
jgi:hypothetical protein